MLVVVVVVEDHVDFEPGAEGVGDALEEVDGQSDVAGFEE